MDDAINRMPQTSAIDFRFFFSDVSFLIAL